MLSYNDKTLSWVWLDLDDTLIDFHANSRMALAAIYHDLGFNSLWPDPQAWIENYENHNTALWSLYSAGAVTREALRMERFRRPLRDAGMDDSEARELSDRLDPLYLDKLAQGRILVPGALQLLKSLRQAGAKIGVLSNGFEDIQYRKINNTGLLPYIDLTVLSDEIGVNKPNPEIFRHAMQRSGDLDPDRHIMVGDNPATDIAGAVSTGWQAIWFSRDDTAPAIYHNDGVAVCSTLDEVNALLTGISPA
ncbi:MAG: YjjG family noncanonical pyrimidine nucleotidase [Paramuribaculum sp.]|nr:YjjG family noncanonical pyrimidine nucleotidase [Paramuribaculum sp.]